MALVPAILLCLLLPFLTLLSSTTAQTRANISLGSSLTAADNNLSWESPSGHFAFGFQQIGKDGFLLAIWFSKIPQKTIVWSANGNNLVQRGSKVQLTEVGLVLSDTNGEQIWEITSPGVAYGAMLDTGNFVLADQSSAPLRESFNEPTDTLLPAQTLARGMKLVARYSETNYSGGKYYFAMESSGKLELYARNFPLDVAQFGYWRTNTEDSGFVVIFNQSGFIYLQGNNGTVLNMLSTPASSTQDFYQRAVLEHDGVFQHYVHPKRNDSSSSGWKMGWSKSSPAIPSNICMSIIYDGARGLCGFNNYCTLRDDQRPKCQCPEGYSLIDPNDVTKGCKQSFETQSCEDSRDADSFYIYSMENTNFPFSDFAKFDQVTEDWYRKNCLADCFCAVATFYDSTCYMKKTPLVNGVKDVNITEKALIKVRKDNSTSNRGDIGTCSRKKDNSALLLIVSVLLSSSVFLNILLLLAACAVLFFKRKANQNIRSNEVTLEMNLQAFTYEELGRATNGFNEQLGSGAFGTVFKGVLLSDQESNLVAIKKLDSMVREDAHEQEFKAEVCAIGHTNHKNLVKLIGFCKEDQHSLLVYEFISNGS